MLTNGEYSSLSNINSNNNSRNGKSGNEQAPPNTSTVKQPPITDKIQLDILNCKRKDTGETAAIVGARMGFTAGVDLLKQYGADITTILDKTQRSAVCRMREWVHENLLLV